MKSILIIVITFIVSYFVFTKILFKEESKSQDVEFKITSQEIFQEFQNNAVAANQKYNGKRIEVTGTLINFTVSMGDNICWIGSPDDVVGEVACIMSKEFVSQASNFKKGDLMKLNGICKGTYFNGVVKLE